MIGRELAYQFRSYLYGNAYYSPHGHHHSIYRFPVYSDYGVSYRPYAYCEGGYYGVAGNYVDGDLHLGHGYRY